MGKQDDEQVLNEVAESITNGKPVDWPAVESQHPGLRRHLQHLKLVEAVAAVHRTPAGGIPPEESLGSVEEGMRTLATEGAGGHGPASRPSWGPLQILEILGQGGFGEVYRAYDPSLQREVALKLRRPDGEESRRGDDRFLEEARRLARVRHPNVLVVHGADEHGGRAGLWTDLIRGKTLEEVLKEQGPLGAHEACLVGMELCRALAALHGAGLVHRDVKAANVMREEGGRIVLMDFGSVTEQPQRVGPPGSEGISGTPLYMSPEQLLGEEPAPVSDIYSLGVLLYHLVSGGFPVEASTFEELVEKHRRRDSKSLRDLRPDLPASFVQVVELALSADPARRFASAGAMERSLAASSGLAIRTEGADRDEERREPRSLRWILPAVLTAVLLATAALTAWFLYPAAPFSAEVALFRKGQVTEERLGPGSRIRPGDQLFLEIQGREPMYVYVMNEDQNGHAYLLFPVGLDMGNPLPPGSRHRLPGRQDGVDMNWRVSSPGGREEILVVASRKPLPDLERDLAKLPRAEKGREIAYPLLGPESRNTLRGVGGLAPDRTPEEKEAAQRVPDVARGFSAGAGNRNGIWVWRIQLQNPPD